MNQDRCIVCGFQDVSDDAHVKPRREFDRNEPDRLLNIIPLCPTHHRMFDRGLIGVCPDSYNLIILQNGEVSVEAPVGSLENIRDKYIQNSNSKLQPQVKAATGLIPSQKHASKCPEDQE